jgi:hypothetical protein
MPHAVSEIIILAHELCGHAWYYDQEKLDPRPQPRGDRPGHDQAINKENEIRREQYGEGEVPPELTRGLYDDPKRGEAIWRVKRDARLVYAAPLAWWTTEYNPWRTDRPTAADIPTHDVVK